jgi:hypothetical protein
MKFSVIEGGRSGSLKPGGAMGIPPMDWRGAWTLEAYVISLFERGATNTSEFKLLVTIYGRDKLVTIWEKHQQEKRAQQGLNPSNR